MNIFESIIDVTRNDLDPSIFNKIGDSYDMRPDVVGFLNNVVDEINQNIVDIDDYYIKGSILSFQWLDNTDVDVIVEVSEDIGEDDRRKIQDKIDERYSINIPNTEHPMQIYVHPGKYNTENADGIYRLDGSGWVKGPYNITVHIEDYLNKFNKMVGSVDISTGELKRNLIDYEMLKDLPENEIKNLSGKINKKLEDINKTVEDIVFQYKHIRNMRHTAFREDMSPQEIAKYGSKNSLPENVIFKLMERYYYLSMMRELKGIVEKSKIDTDEEVEQIKNSIEKTQFGE